MSEQQQQQQSPPAYSPSPYQHDPERLFLPAVPQNDPARQWPLPSISHAPNHHATPNAHCRLPPIQSLLSSAQDGDDPIPKLLRLPDVPQTLPGFAHGPASISRDTDVSSPMDVDDVATNPSSTEDRSARAGSIVSMDDPDVRIAAEALGDLRAGEFGFPSPPSSGSAYRSYHMHVNSQAPDFIQSPPHSHAAISSEHASSLSPSTSARFGSPQQPEPLLSLLTSSHPLLSNAITGSLSAYSTSKNRSPRFLKYGAELMERHIGSPVASTVGSVGRRTGVEDSVRRYLGGGTATPEKEEDEETANKRRRIGDPREDIDIERGLHHQHLASDTPAHRRASEVSSESLPAYDDQRSPKYEEKGNLATMEPPEQGSSTPNGTWQSRLMMSTSGLGVAMSEESLKRLKFCFEWLRAANRLIGTAIVELGNALQEWEQSQQQKQQSTDPESAISSHPVTGDQAPTTNGEKSHTAATTPLQEEDEELARRIKKWKEQIVNTLKKAVEIVSTYTGAALPENARRIVRSQLTSLPARFRYASRTSAPPGNEQIQPSATASSAHRVIVLAREGLEMIAQVSNVLDGTIVSAEVWCERLGRRRPADQEEAGAEASQRSQFQHLQLQQHQQQQQHSHVTLPPLNQSLGADVKVPSTLSPEDQSETRPDEKMGGC
ncbi:MAG: hypothetical protein M4579_002197 [Chaenotheca gracillima]|nr:MAG: hypothetical protein M4579_002197 [Chaenotheca gracillima]